MVGKIRGRPRLLATAFLVHNFQTGPRQAVAVLALDGLKQLMEWHVEALGTRLVDYVLVVRRRLCLFCLSKR